MNDDQKRPVMITTPESGEELFYSEMRQRIEGNLLTYMKEIGDNAEYFLELAAESLAPQQRERYLSVAIKVCRTYAELSKAFHHNSGRGMVRQDINVNYHYLNVTDGGQAIVGDVTTQQGGGDKKNGKRSHTKQNQSEQLGHAPQPTMPRAHAQGYPMPITGDD